jgi:hypothetical protein
VSTRRRSLLVTAAVSVAVAIVGIWASLAINAATSGTAHWPGPLDLIRRYPWWFVLALTVVLAILTACAVFSSESGPSPASADDVLASEERVRQQVDRVEVRRSQMDERVARLPPHPRVLLDAAGEDRDVIWKVIAAFTDDAVVPQDLARE